MGLKLKAVSAYLPKKKESNEDLEKAGRVPYKAEDILRKTGIASRRIAGRMSSCDMAVKAATKLFDSGAVSRDKVDWIIFCTQTPDYLIPSTSCIFQDRMNLSTKTKCFDINLACSGFVYAMVIIDSLLKSGAAKSVLMINADTYTRFLEPQDAKVVTIFGDAATAAYFELDKNDNNGICGFSFGTDGDGYDKLIKETGGSAEVKLAHPDPYIRMNGSGIFRFVQNTIPGNIKNLLKKHGYSVSDVDQFFFHQASKYMLEALANRIGVGSEAIAFTASEIGNTVSSTIPLMLAQETCENNQALNGKLAVLSGFGAGLSYGSLIFRFADDLIRGFYCD